MPSTCQHGTRIITGLAGFMPASLIALCLVISGCSTSSIDTVSQSNPASSQQADDSLSPPQLEQFVPGPALSTDSDAANYLIGHTALTLRDLNVAADYFTRTLAGDKTNPDLLQRSFLTLYQTGQIDEAAIIARQIEAANISLPLSSEPAAVIAITNADWDAAQALSDQMLASGGASNLAYLTSIWSKFARGQETAALSDMTRFSRDMTGADIPPFMYLHLSHLAELSDQPDSARAYLDFILNGGAESAEVIISAAASYWRLGKEDVATQLLTDRLGSNFYAPKLLDQMQSAASELTRPLTLQRAVAQSILDEAWLNANQSGSGLLMPHAYLALRIDPELHAARFVLAQLYTAMNKLDMAQQFLDAIPHTSVWSQPATFLHINILIEKEALADARTRLTTELDAWPENRRLYHLLGDLYRRDRLCEDALTAYADAEKRGDRSGALYRSKGVCYAELQEMALAEDNLQRAIDLNPNDASALNYLGYLWADEGRNLDRALSYIEDAVRLRPDSGYYADSLGWVYYRMDELDLSVSWLEKAFQLTPGDIVISEHLADAYWRVGRWHEARYKWHYALELADAADDIARIEAKLALEHNMPLPSQD